MIDLLEPEFIPEREGAGTASTAAAVNKIRPGAIQLLDLGSKVVFKEVDLPGPFQVSLLELA